MNPEQFIAKWRGATLSDGSACRQHFLDLCEVFDHPKPTEADPEGDWFVFGKIARNSGVDVWKREYFGWKYKGQHKNLDAAYHRLFEERTAWDNPPLLAVCDGKRIEIHTNFRASSPVVYEIPLEMLDTPRNLEILHALFHEPHKLQRVASSPSSSGGSSCFQVTSEKPVVKNRATSQPIIKPNAKQFLDLVERSGLLEPLVVAELTNSAREFDMANKSGTPPLDHSFTDADHLTDFLVNSELLTRWQCDQLLKGKFNGFFLGKYKLLSHIGTGGMGRVYLAEHTLIRHPVAIKVIPKHRAEDATYIKRFHLEAKTGVSLAHPHIVRTYDTDSEGNTHYLVMEYIEGQNLQDMVLQEGTLGTTVAANYIAQVAQGLQYAHDTGLVHRDIKPSNILVDDKGVVKILDMGLARFRADDVALLEYEDRDGMIGTADYLSPEQATDSQKVDGRSDIYSLGCTFYFLLTGHPPFPEGTASERLEAHRTRMPSSIRSECPYCPETLAGICEKMMSKKPKDRFQTASLVSEVLQQWLEKRQRALYPSKPAQGQKDNRATEITKSQRDDEPPQTFVWEIDLVCSDCGHVGSPVVQSLTLDNAHDARNQPTILGTSSCKKCGHDLNEARSEKLIEMFQDVEPPPANRRLMSSIIAMVLLFLLATSLVTYYVYAKVWNPFWAVIALGLVLSMIGSVIMLVNFKKASAVRKCECGKADYTIMGLLGGSYCFRCTSCGNLRRMRN